MSEIKKKCTGNWEILRYLKCRPGAADRGFGPRKVFFSCPMSTADFQGEEKGNKADSVICKMANGRESNQHITNYLHLILLAKKIKT